MGTVTTGEPGTDVVITNTGTDENAVFNFTIPRGFDGGGTVPLDVLTAYSTPPQVGTENTELIFDRNGTLFGTSIQHAENTSEFTINGSGIYYVSFHGTISPVSGVTFPINILVNLQQDGTIVSGSEVQHTFHTSTENVNVAFSTIITANPNTTFRIVGTGGQYFYSSIGINIYKIANLP